MTLSWFINNGNVQESNYTLSLVFDAMENIPVSNPNSVSDWNTFFNLPANGNAFTSVSVGLVSDESDPFFNFYYQVDLTGGSNIHIKDNAFQGSTHIVEVKDTGAVVVLGTNSFAESYVTTIVLPALTEIKSNAFYFCTQMQTASVFPNVTIVGGFAFSKCWGKNLSLPKATTIGGSAFAESILETISIPVCTALGETTNDDGVFEMAQALRSVTVPAALMTIKNGSPDGDLQYLLDTYGNDTNAEIITV